MRGNWKTVSGVVPPSTLRGHLAASARVQILYKRGEIPANKVVPAIAVSVTYRKHEKAENPGSIPVRELPTSFKINHLQDRRTKVGTGALPQRRGQGRESRLNSRRNCPSLESRNPKIYR